MVLIVNLKNSGTDIDLLYINISYCMDHFVNSTVFLFVFFLQYFISLCLKLLSLILSQQQPSV